MEKHCLQCGGIFIAPKFVKNTKLYCSQKCSKAYWRQHGPSEAIERNRTRIKGYSDYRVEIVTEP